jgi:14-3-3 protein epsilon
MFEDAFLYTKMLLNLSNQKLNQEERILLMKSAKARFNFFRNAWKNLMDQQSETESQIPRESIEAHILKLENEIKLFCRDLDETLNNLLKNSDQNDFHEIIFYKKLRADYLRYFSEVSNQDEFANIVEVCEESYKEAYLLTQEKLSSHDTLTLSVALNYSIFAYFILDDTKKAFDIADKATKAADKNMNKIDNQDDKEYKMLYKSLEENLTIWKIELFDVN